MTGAKKTMPTRTLLQGMPYVSSVNTNIAVRFEAIKRARIQAQSPNVAQIRKAQK